MYRNYEGDLLFWTGSKLRRKGYKSLINAILRREMLATLKPARARKAA
jgi:hypothetical protein